MILRLAKKTDIDFYFLLANDRNVRMNSINKQTIKFFDHKIWFNNKIISSSSYLFVLENEGELVGQIRFDKELDCFEIDYSISEAQRGCGYGYQLLLKGIFEILYLLQPTSVKFKGKVLESNKGSYKVFERIGFEKKSKEAINGEVLQVFELENAPKTNILLSSRAWNYSIINDLKSIFKVENWLYCDTKNEFIKDRLDIINPDTIFIPHWSYIISESIFLNYECIVFHMTDLPYGRGGSPLQNLIIRGHENTKISAIRVVKGLDAGPIYLKSNLSLHGTAQEIFLRASSIIKDMILKIHQEKLSPISQEGEIVEFSRRTSEMSSIEGIDEYYKLYDHIRMLDADGYPNAYFENEYFRFEFSRASFKANKNIIADVKIIKK